MPAYSVAVFLSASNCARLPAEGIEAVGKETVDKRKKPETVTTHNKETTTKRERERKGGGDKGNGTKRFKTAQSDVISRHEASVVVAWALTPDFPVRAGRL